MQNTEHGLTYPIKSLECQHRSLVRFCNFSKRRIAIIWLDFKGNPIPYRILNPVNFVDVTTFVSHPWIFIDINTGDRLMGNKKFVYYPECWSETKKRLPQDHLHLSEGRLIVPITMPLYSLRDCSMQVVRDTIQSKEAILELELPSSLKKDLVTMFVKKNLFKEKKIAPQS